MKRIRIGNDIRVQTSLHDLNDFDITSIKQLRCYFIPQGDSYTVSNTDTYDPMQYTICNCGKPKYNVFPCNMDAPHWFCGYNGFGVNSKRFVHVDSKFLAPARLLAEQNRIEAYFPAKAQYQIGEYKFVIVLTIYQPGWCEDNLRTITLDEGVIFALTNDDRDTDTDTIIDLDKPASKEYTIQYNYDNTQYTVTGPSKITVLNSDLQTDKLVGNFNIVCLGENNINNTQVTSTECVVKTIGNQTSPKIINGALYCPITATGDVITINISAKPVDPKPVDKEYTYTINYYYNDEQCTIEGPQQIKVLDSKRFLNEKIGSFYVTCIGENPDSSNIQLKVTGCNVQNSAGDETSCKYDLYGPITTSNGIIKVDISIKSDIPDQTNVTSIVVPDKVVLQHTSHLNIGDLGYNGTAYNVRINYSDGSHKLINADEFSKLITVVTGDTGNITVAETGMIARLNMFENVDEQVTYQLKENPSIKDTMRIVSSGKMYRISYNYDSNYVTVNGNDSAYVDDTTKTGDALPVATFTVIPTNDEYTMTSLDMEITGASLSNKPDPNTSVTKAEVTIVTPVTLDEITIIIIASQFRP